jgi:hypothetical protein
VAAGWLVLQVLKPENFRWELAIAALLGLLLTFALLGHWVSGGATIGAFGLGAGASVIVWGIARVGQGGDRSGARKR